MSDRVPLFRRILGDAFDHLDGDLQRFHGLSGAHRLQGICRVQGAEHVVGRWLAALLGLPRGSDEAAFDFELRTIETDERWTRRFAGRAMHSRLSEKPPGHLSERLGAVRLVFALTCQDHALHMRLCAIHALGMRWPRGWLPEVWADETGIGGYLHFDIGARLGTFGLLVAYRGRLDLSSAVPIA